MQIRLKYIVLPILLVAISTIIAGLSFGDIGNQEEAVSISQLNTENSKMLADSSHLSLIALTNRNLHIVVLNWEVKCKSDVCYELYKSCDGNANWVRIGLVKADAGVDSGRFEFTDKSAQYLNFYRIKSIHSDSSVTFSNTAKADFTLNQPSILASFNPSFYGYFKFTLKKACTYTVVSETGSIVKTGIGQQDNEIGNLPSGRYSLNLIYDYTIETFTIQIR